jgi:putative nucleotidyltransferase with HDIG domain
VDPGEREQQPPRPDMKIAIDVAQLKLGMYVCELDRPWRETPFLFQGFEIRSQDEIDSLREHCRQVVILKGGFHGNVAFTRTPAPAGSQPIRQVVEPLALRLEQEIYKLNNHPGARSEYEDRTTLTEEVERVRDTFIEARLLIQEMLFDAKLGRVLKLANAKRVVRGLAESVIRNPDALMCFAQLKRKDEYLALHSLRSCILALALGRQIGMARTQLEVLGLAALLHDIGFIRVPDELLRKSVPLTKDEDAVVRRHVAWGVEIVSGIGHVPSAVLEIIAQHHERFDGSGYDGLRGVAISDAGTIVGLVDHYDDITSARPGHDALSPHTVLMKMYGWRNTLFKAELVEKFIQCLGVYPIGSAVQLNTGEVGVVAAINRQQRLKPHVMLVYRADHTPYEHLPITNVATRRTPDDRACEIERALEPGALGIDPVFYLRVAVSL